MSSTKTYVKLSLALILVILTSCSKNQLYDTNLSNVVNLNQKNFDTQITLNRSKNIVSIVHFYTMDDGKSKGYKDEFEKLASDYDLMFKVGGINCKDFKQLCEKQEIKEYPTVKVYPPLPAPVWNYEGKIETSSMVSYMGKFIGNKVKELNMNNFEDFLSTNPNLPKTLLFTDKKGTPLIFKALSVSFDVRIKN
jgi:thioredoxin-like negative regulator of GroEL